MIEVDISNVWGEIALPDLLAMEREVFDAHMKLTEGAAEECTFLGWQALPTREETEEIVRIRKAAEKIRRDSQVCVVMGTGGSCLGARAAIELLQGVQHNIGKGEGSPQIFFAGNSLSTCQWNALIRLLEGKDFSVIVISKSGTTLEPAIAFRSLRWMMERKYGTDEANSRIYCITDPEIGALKQMAEEARWETFVIPPDVSSGYAVLTAAGLLPMAVAGMDVLEVLSGAMDAKESYDLRSYENPAWLYAAVRNLLYRSGKKIEVLESFEPDFRTFGSWWKQLFAASEGKEGKGIFPATAEFPADMHSLGQLLQQGERNLFGTMIRFAPCSAENVIGSDWNNLDDLNYLEGKSLDFVEEQACLGILDAHVDSAVPVLTMDCGELCEKTIGELFYFLQLSCAISACVLGVDPFARSGVDRYKQNLFSLLGKPGCET